MSFQALSGASSHVSRCLVIRHLLKPPLKPARDWAELIARTDRLDVVSAHLAIASIAEAAHCLAHRAQGALALGVGRMRGLGERVARQAVEQAMRHQLV